MTHEPRHMAQRSKRFVLGTDVTVRKAVSAGMTIAIPSVGAVIAAAPSEAAPDSSSSVTLLDTTPTGAAAPHNTVMFGSRGDDVKTVQTAVGVPADGVFGPLTLAAVRAYQNSHGLVADGVVGPLTWAVVDGSTATTQTSVAPATTSDTAAASTPTPAVPSTPLPTTTTATSTQAPVALVTKTVIPPKTVWIGSSDSVVKVLQSKLSAPITGVFARDLQTAVKSYQASHNLVPDGVVGPLTWGKLGVSASDAAALAPTLTVAAPQPTTPVVTPAPTTPTVSTSFPTPTPTATVTTTPTPPTPVTPTPVTTAPEESVATGSTPTTPAITVAAASTDATAAQIIAFAENYLGVAYAYGHSDPTTGFDCSGFTSYVFSHFGYTIPRTAAQQQAYFQPTTNPQPGDLLFYGYPAYHVAIYLGNGMMLESNHPGGSVGIRAIYGTPAGYARVINH